MDCEAVLHHERSAALAVFHGDLRAAVSALQRGAEVLTQRLTMDEDDALEVSPIRCTIPVVGGL